MHMGRIITIVGSVIAVVAMFIKKASSEGEAALAQLSQVPDSPFPADLAENTIVALYNDSTAGSIGAILFGLAAIAAFVLAVLPPIKEPMKRVLAMTVTLMGAIMAVISLFAIKGALDDADTLEQGFNGAAEAGAIPVAFTVSIGFGWYMLLIASVIVAVGGLMGVMANSETDD